MEPMPKMSRQQYVALMQKAMEAILGEIADAINDAPDGCISSASEQKVRDLFSLARRQAFALGVQMRKTAAEAAFSPAEASPNPQELNWQELPQ